MGITNGHNVKYIFITIISVNQMNNIYSVYDSNSTTLVQRKAANDYLN